MTSAGSGTGWAFLSWDDASRDAAGVAWRARDFCACGLIVCGTGTMPVMYAVPSSSMQLESSCGADCAADCWASSARLKGIKLKKTTTTAQNRSLILAPTSSRGINLGWRNLLVDLKNGTCYAYHFPSLRPKCLSDDLRLTRGLGEIHNCKMTQVVRRRALEYWSRRKGKLAKLLLR